MVKRDWVVGAGVFRSHTDKVKQKSNWLTSLSNSNVPGLERLLRRQVSATIRARSASSCANARVQTRLAKTRPAVSSHGKHPLKAK
jgi:hypothetical protein